MRTIGLCVAAAVFAAGCSSPPRLLRHYGQLEAPQQLPDSLALSVFLAKPSTAQENPVVFSLSERAQAELIRSINGRISGDGGAEKLMSLMAEPTQPDPSPCAWANKTSMSKQLVFTVLGELAKPADRIDKLDIRLTLVRAGPGEPPREPGATFASWDRFTPEYFPHEIGSAKLTQSNKLTAGTSRSATANLPGAAGALERKFNLGYESDTSLEENAHYVLRRLSVGGALQPTNAQLVQEGGPNVSLFGSSSATISFKLTPGQPDAVYALTLPPKGQSADPSRSRAERCLGTYPGSIEPIVAMVSGTALLREVLSGDGTVSEGDDTIRLRAVKLSEIQVELATPSELAVPRFGLATCPPRANLKSCHRLHIEHSGVLAGAAEQLLLASFQEAAALREWLVTQSTKGRTVKSIGELAIGLAPTERAIATKPGPLDGVDAPTAAGLRVVQLGGNDFCSASAMSAAGQPKGTAQPAEGGVLASRCRALLPRQ